ncbi:MFS transporter [Corynebacterium sp. CCUG 65737]|uniref:MFS transporter n=1 Tax=Corynebacterium sp. CCUG 65737 TaxID=2823889 RepID=UPI00210B5319|nr:MFS transporter [Corynebacterium sp. CCUG 65737]MCQ4626671.1 MFS transporter [Corynebacterium sp. CCUG 65737]
MLKKLWPYLLGSVALGLDAYVIAGLLSNIAKDLDASESIIGLGVTAFTAAYALSGPILSGKAGVHARKSLVIGIIVFSLANLATALSPNAVTFILSRVIAGSAAGVYSPLSSAVAAHSVPEEKSGKALSLVLAGLALGTVLGVPTGLIIATNFGWRLTIAMITAIGLIALLGVALNKKQTVPTIPASSFKERAKVMAKKTNIFTILVTLFVGTASLGLYTYISTVLAHTPLDNHQIVGIWVWGIGGAIGAFGVGHLLDGFRKPRTLTLSIICAMALSFIAILYGATNMIVVVAAIFAWGLLGWSSLAPQQKTLLETNPSDGATAVAANSSANYLGSALGSALGALVVPNFDFLLWGALAFVLLGGIMHGFAVREEKRASYVQPHNSATV